MGLRLQVKWLALKRKNDTSPLKGKEENKGVDADVISDLVAVMGGGNLMVFIFSVK